MAINKDQGIRIGINQIITYATLVPILWFIAQPLLISAVSDAMAEDIKETVKGEVAPVTNAFKVLLTLDINNKRKEIAGLQFRQRQQTDWTGVDADTLAEAEIELDALQAALLALQDTG